MKTLYLECAMGAAGDMLTAALLELTGDRKGFTDKMKSLGLLQKSSRWDPVVCGAQQLLDFAPINGAKAVGMADKIGSLEPGKYADLIILDGKAPNMRPLVPENMIANIVYSGNGLNTKTVFCQGDMVMQDGNILTLDKDDILSKSEDVWRQLCIR